MLAKTVDSKFQSSNMVKHLPLVTRLHSPTKALRLSREAFACLSPWGVSTRSLPLTDWIKRLNCAGCDRFANCLHLTSLTFIPAYRDLADQHAFLQFLRQGLAFFLASNCLLNQNQQVFCLNFQPKHSGCLLHRSFIFKLHPEWDVVTWAKGNLGICLIPMGTVKSSHHLVSLTSCITVYK